MISSSSSSGWSLHSLSPSSVSSPSLSSPLASVPSASLPLSAIPLSRRLFISPLVSSPLCRSSLSRYLRPAVFDSFCDLSCPRALWFPGLSEAEFDSLWALGDAARAGQLARMRNQEKQRLIEAMESDLASNVLKEKRSSAVVSHPLVFESKLRDRAPIDRGAIPIDRASHLIDLLMRQLPGSIRPLFRPDCSADVSAVLLDCFPGPLDSVHSYLLAELHSEGNGFVSRERFLDVWNTFVASLVTQRNWKDFIQPNEEKTSEKAKSQEEEEEETEKEPEPPLNSQPQLTALCSIM